MEFETSQGAFVIEVHRDWARHGDDRFYNLARDRFYDDLRFTRVVSGFIAQFGYTTILRSLPFWKTKTIPDDPVKQSNKRSFVAFAMTGPNTRTTQVYINTADNTRTPRITRGLTNEASRPSSK